MLWPLPRRFISPPYISHTPFLTDLGTQVHPSYYTAGTVLTALSYLMTVTGERILRSRRVMSEATDEHVLWVGVASLDVLAAVLAAVALALPGLYQECRAHAELQIALLAFFVVAVGVSGLLQTAEVHHLWHEQ
jgi:hypothetical protein